MRKPRPDPPLPAAPAAPAEPAGGRALQRARQFALQRGLAAPDKCVAPAKPAPGGGRPARKKA
ncbi:MAG: hypothetical protein ABI699_06180 [Caldimonas sp.]